MKKAGYPEWFAQEALGHNSKAVHRAYARKAQVELPPLSEYERQRARFTEAAKAIQPVARAVTASMRRAWEFPQDSMAKSFHTGPAAPTNYLDMGLATNFPSCCYRIRLVP